MRLSVLILLVRAVVPRRSRLFQLVRPLLRLSLRKVMILLFRQLLPSWVVMKKPVVRLLKLRKKRLRMVLLLRKSSSSLILSQMRQKGRSLIGVILFSIPLLIKSGRRLSRIMFVLLLSIRKPVLPKIRRLRQSVPFVRACFRRLLLRTLKGKFRSFRRLIRFAGRQMSSLPRSLVPVNVARLRRKIPWRLLAARRPLRKRVLVQILLIRLRRARSKKRLLLKILLLRHSTWVIKLILISVLFKLARNRW